MFLTLTLIAERIHLEKGEMYLRGSCQKKYQEIMFYPGNVPVPLSPDILYLSRGIPPTCGQEDQLQGLICIAGTDQFSSMKEQVQKLPCSCLLLGTDFSMEDIFNLINGRISFLRRQMDIFRTAVYTQQSLQKLIEMIFDIMGNPAYLVDSSFKVLAIDRNHDMRNLSAAWRRLEDEGYLPFDLVSSLISSGELSLMESGKKAVLVNSRYFYVPFINYNLIHYGKIKGHLFIAGMKKTISKSDIELAEQLGDYVLELMQRSSGFQNKRGDYYEHFMRDLFSGRLTDQDSIRRQMNSLGAHEEDYFTVAVLHTSSEHGLSDERIASQMERCSGAKPVFYQDKIAALFRHGKKSAIGSLGKDLKRLSAELHCEIGVSDTIHGFYDLHTCYLQGEWALTCPDFLKKSGTYPLIRYYKDYAVQHVLHVFSKNDRLKALIAPELFLLHQYDQDNHTELLHTLYVYLLHERSALLTSRLLHIHRNTLAYRMNKISELCGFLLEDGAVRQRLLLALEAMHTVGDF